MLNRLLLSGIFACLLVPSLAFAYSGAGDRWSLGVSYNYMNEVDMSSFTTGHETSPTYGTPDSVGASYKGQAALLEVTYHSMSGFFFTLFGGMTMNAEIDSGRSFFNNTPTSVSEAWTFNSAPTYGATFGYDIFTDSRVHLAPSIRWQQTKFSGTAGSLYNSSSNSTYTYGTTNSTGGTFSSVGGTVIPNGATDSLSTSFNQTLLNAQIGLSFDIISDGINTLTIGGGVEDAMVFMSGNVTHSENGGFTAAEAYDFGSNTQLGYFAMLNMSFGPVYIGGEGHFTAEKFYVAHLGVNF